MLDHVSTLLLLCLREQSYTAIVNMKQYNNLLVFQSISLSFAVASFLMISVTES